MLPRLSAFLFFAALAGAAGLPATRADDGYELWLRYRPEPNPARKTEYAEYAGAIVAAAPSEAGPAGKILAAAQAELRRGLTAIAGPSRASGYILIGRPEDSPAIRAVLPPAEEAALGPEGFVVKPAVLAGRKIIVVAGGGPSGVLYGAFHLLQYLQNGYPVADLDLRDAPRARLRLANHWDNPVIGTDHWAVERGYAGASLFQWDTLPDHIDPRLQDYARLLASLGINGTDVNNVNTAKHGLEGWRLLTPAWLPKLTALAAVLRPYGIRLYLSANFFSPSLIDHLPTADPLDPRVMAWWRTKADQIYAAIPDFGGFVVKADSENEPGPYKYGRTHADGANMIAAALAPHGGTLFWRAFVYTEAGDRVTDAYRNFRPLDGKFAPNAIVQIKNGPLDFQIREPVSPLIGGLPHTPKLLEVEITQEYTGQDQAVCFLAPLWHEALAFDTFAHGEGSTVAREVVGICGVMNLGADRNWTGHLLAQANTYAFGRLAWNPATSPAEIADAWTRLTFGRDPVVLATVDRILLESRRVFENYTAPLGLGLLTARGNHFEPAPAYRQNYHHADAHGIGYDRTAATGSGFAAQYLEPWRSRYEALDTCPDDLLLFFHHVPYDYRLADGRTVIAELAERHRAGAAQAHDFVTQWGALKGRIDDERFNDIRKRLQHQAELADHWRDTINGYFAKISGVPAP